MDKTELNSYIRQALAMLIIYIAFMIPVIHFNPESASMECNAHYTCNVKITYIWNISRTASFIVNDHTHLQFYQGYNPNPRVSGFVNIYDGSGLNLDPFGTKNFYTFNADYKIKDKSVILEDINHFNDYIKNPHEKFVLSNKFNNKLPGLIVTIIFIAFLITKNPLQNFLGILRIIFTNRFRPY